MQIDAIVYTSHTGHTQQYAQMLGEKTGLPVYALSDARSKLPKGSRVIYLGWIQASHVKDYPKAAKQFTVCAVCGVGLCDTGTMVDETRKATQIPHDIPLFTLQGGFDGGKLKGLNKLMISMLMRGLSAQEQRSEQDERMLELLSKNASYVCKENLSEVLHWYSNGNI